MMKTLKAALSILLVLLTLLTALPLTALAEEPETQLTPVDNNTSENKNPTVDSGEIMSQNTGTVTSNQGTITNNGEPQEDGTMSNPASGTVEINEYNARIENNYGTVKTNDSGRTDYDEVNGTVTTIAGVEKNYGLVETNAQGGVIKDNHGSVGTFDDDRGVPNTTNEGEVTNNLAHGFVFNGKNGVVVQNCSDESDEGWYGGFVNNYGGKVKDNSGLVYNDNNGTVDENRDDGRVVNNSGTVTNNHGTVENYSGTVTNNYGYVYGYDATNAKVTNNDGSVHGGTVETNNVGGEVFDRFIGHIDDETKEWVTDLVKSKVTTNYGTHVTFDNLENNLGYERTVHFGVHAMDGDKMVYLGQYQGAMYGDDSPEEVTIEKLQANCKDYKIFGIEKVEDYSWEDKKFVDHNEAALQNGGGPEQTPGTTTGLISFKISAPTRLKLLWEKIVSVVKPATSTDSTPEAKPVKAAAIPTTVEAEDVKVGTTVRAKGQIFKVIEMDDGSMTVVTMGKLSKKDVADLKAFLAKYFTPEQIELLLGDPELISQELAAQLFGGNTGHIVFKAAKNLFA